MYLPAPQFVHDEAVAPEYFPEAQMMQFCLSLV